ncbi:MAG: serine/threonine-protein kinase [Gemmatimonadales bacterium]|nr:serine/threonine-protein kinase [Gemmatimonadales bacterium]
MTDTRARLEVALAATYRIERELGQGGMATVYLAHDVKHDRKVALKVLRPELSAVIGADRFLVEIKTTANLQHPHILALYDSGQVDGTVFYVMPFVEGESLRDRLDREKQLPVGDAVRIATEVAGALDYAHRRGVIHRDIKPANILLHDGRALVADFGIALAASRTEGGSRMTETGMSLGTPHYMSPEQALGERNLDARTDVYALGCVLHEMLAGEPPFDGPTAQAIIARVMSGEPESVTVLRKSVPDHVADAILTALSKLPADRFASAAEFGAALGGGATGGFSRSGATRAAAADRRPQAARLALPAALVLATVLALWGWLRPAAAPEMLPSRLAIPAPGLGGGGVGLARRIDITRDGRMLIYNELVSGESRTMRRTLEGEEGTPLPGMPLGYTGYAVSPNGREFIATDLMMTANFRFPMDGGGGKPLPQQVAASIAVAWSSDGTLWLSPANDRARGIARIGTDGEVTHPFPPERSNLVLQWVLPGDRYALAVRSPAGTAFGTPFLLDLVTGGISPLLTTDVAEIRYTAGLLVYVLPDGSMEAVRFDPRSRQVSGSSVVLATGVAMTGSALAQIAVSDNGTIAYVPAAPRSLVLLDRAGGARTVVPEERNYHYPRFSPDGQRILTDYTSPDGRDAWTISLADGAVSRVTFDRDGHDATWEPDGRFVTYSSALRAGGALSIYRTRPGRGGEVDSLISSSSVSYPGVWLPDRSALVTAGSSLRGDSRGDIAIIRNGGRGPVEALVATRFEESHPALSRDGRWLAYTSDQSGEPEVYLRQLDGEGEQVRISLSGGTEPLWAPSGRELFYRAPAADRVVLMSASLRLGPVVTVAERRQLFDVSEMLPGTPHLNYDISPDGRTFAMVRQNPATRIMVLQNAPALFRQLERGTNR